MSPWEQRRQAGGGIWDIGREYKDSLAMRKEVHEKRVGSRCR